MGPVLAGAQEVWDLGTYRGPVLVNQHAHSVSQSVVPAVPPERGRRHDGGAENARGGGKEALPKRRYPSQASTLGEEWLVVTASEPSSTLCQPNSQLVSASSGGEAPKRASSGRGSLANHLDEGGTPTPTLVEPAPSFYTSHLHPHAGPGVVGLEYGEQTSGEGASSEWSGKPVGRSKVREVSGSVPMSENLQGSSRARYASTAVLLPQEDGSRAGVPRGNARYASKDSARQFEHHRFMGSAPAPLPPWCLTFPGV